jgi:hypothetical protein
LKYNIQSKPQIQILKICLDGNLWVRNRTWPGKKGCMIALPYTDTSCVHTSIMMMMMIMVVVVVMVDWYSETY